MTESEKRLLRIRDVRRSLFSIPESHLIFSPFRGLSLFAQVCHMSAKLLFVIKVSQLL
jgi:hypothetical protein